MKLHRSAYVFAAAASLTATMLNVTASCQKGLAQDAGAAAQPSADQLPQGLDAQLLEGLTPPPSPTPNAVTDPAPQSQPSTPPVGEDIGQPPEHPLRRVAERMLGAQQRLARGDTSPTTQQLQREALDELRQLIERLQQQQSQLQPSGQVARSESEPSQNTGEAPPSPTGGEPGDDQSSGEGDAAPAEGAAGTPRKWGHLPTHVRQQLESAAIERFLPQYEELIEAFYLRLAEDDQQPTHN